MGAGNMVSALLTPLKDHLKDLSVYFYTPSRKSAAILSEQINQNFINGEGDPSWDLHFDGIILAHKPQQLEEASELLKRKLSTTPKFIVSILAGKKIIDIQKIVFDVPVMRLMPNTPSLVGRGIMTEFSSHDFDSTVQIYFRELFSIKSKLVTLTDEKKFDDATPILGSGPGVLFELASIFQTDLIKLGVSEELSKNLVTELFLGSFELSSKSPETFKSLKQNVTSKGGITEKMLEVLEQRDLSGIIKEAIKEGRIRGEKL